MDLLGRVAYFAYGSNMDVAQMKQRCPSSIHYGLGFLRDHRLAFAGHSSTWGGGVATVLRARGLIVLGAVYSVTPKDLKVLDQFEGSKYERKTTRVHTRTASRQRVEIYQLRAGELEAEPSPAYLDLIRRAHASLGYELTTPGYQSTKIPRSSPRAPDNPPSV